MSFGGGGGGALTAHVHDNTPLQGGPLNFDNVTIGSLTNNDMVYSDGNALQRLPIGSPNDVMTVSGGSVPSWVAGGAAGWSLLGSVSEATPTSSLNVSITGTDILRVFWMATNNAAGDDKVCLRFNGDAGNNYGLDEGRWRAAAGTPTSSQQANTDKIEISETQYLDFTFTGCFDVLNLNGGNTYLANGFSVLGNTNMLGSLSDPDGASMAYGSYFGGATSITSIQLVSTGGSTGGSLIKGRMVVYGTNFS